MKKKVEKKTHNYLNISSLKTSLGFNTSYANKQPHPPLKLY